MEVGGQCKTVWQSNVSGCGEATYDNRGLGVPQLLYCVTPHTPLSLKRRRRSTSALSLDPDSDYYSRWFKSYSEVGRSVVPDEHGLRKSATPSSKPLCLHP